MSDTPTLVDIAAAIRRNSPGVLPESLSFDGQRFGIGGVDHTGTIPTLAEMPDDIARSVLGFAMVMDCCAHRDWCADGSDIWWYVDQGEMFRDEDHSNDPLLSLYAAWLWGKGLSNA